MTSEEEKFQLELKSIFLEELEDGLEKIEASFLKFDSNRDNYEIVHDIFRNFHNIKGSSKTVGFEALSNFAHSAENLLSLIRDGEIKASDEIVSSLLVCLDIMRSYSEAIQKGDNSFNEKLISHSKVLDHHIDSAPRIGSQSLGTEEKKPEVDTGFGFFEDEPKTKVQDELEEPNVIRKDKIDEGSVTESQEIEENAKKEIANNTDSKNSEPTSAASAITKSSLSMLKKEESLKVSMPKINQILDLFGEQVIIQSALDHEMQKENVDMDYVEKSIGQLRKITQDLQHTLVTLRMVSMETLFNRMQRSIRDVALITNKKVDFIKIGQTSELDKSIVDSLIDPLTHMVRNAVDHGLELPEDRLKSGKPELGTVTMKAQRHGGTFEITIEDDGKGINKKNILDKAIKKGIVKDGAHLSDNQVFNLIFESGFSTLDSASVISGRGVGMDVVKQQIKKLKGVYALHKVPLS